MCAKYTRLHPFFLRVNPAATHAALPSTAWTLALLPSPSAEIAAERISPRPAPALKDKKFNSQWRSETEAERREEPETPPAVPKTLAPAQPAVPPAPPKVPIAAPRSGKQKTDSRRVLNAKPRAPAGNTTADRTQVPTSEPPPTTFAEAVRDVNASRETPAPLPAEAEFTGLQQRIALLTKQMQATTQQLAAMQNSLSTLVDTCTRAVIERLTMLAIIPFEINGPLPALPQYDGLAPDIKTSAPLPRIRSALYIHRSMRFTPLDTSQWCSTMTSVTGCRLLVTPQRPVLLCLCDPRHFAKPQDKAAAKYRLYDVLVCGDFNAKHTAWGYDIDLPRGTRLLADLMELKLPLLKTLDAPTRIGQSSRQQDTCPDLTCARFPRRWRWQVTVDHLGSDHLPITLHYDFPSRTPSHRRARRDTFFTKRDKFRAALTSVMELAGFSDIIQAILSAHSCNSPDLREIIRDVVREEIRRLLPAAASPDSPSINEIVREEVQQALQPQVSAAPEPPTLSYAAATRRPPPPAHPYMAPPRREPPAPQFFRRQEDRVHAHPEQAAPRKTDVWRTADRRPLCYHCGEADHIYRRCPYRQLGLRGEIQ
ncbi:hypothetical protein HPB47_020373 [Ixodes persulcatus]|uniref:Uncharacterized protein n=1 Tax=Ixodes persulcatus TaxID=34615 RepID=A0AC60QFR4_IXOPE|nr:hypothetical protein HPB47_020373 [Ixodes persulcatus]